ncbi:hypothetical protein BJX65DRAFT_290226 [Aspergillus insuetus]
MATPCSSAPLSKSLHPLNLISQLTASLNQMPTLDLNLYTIAWIAPLEIKVQAARYVLDKVHSGGFPVGPSNDYVCHAGEIHGHNVMIAIFAASQ